MDNCRVLTVGVIDKN
jgi:signal transduction histidine kinase